MLTSIRRRRLIAALASAGVFAPAAALVRAETVFFDDFDGPTMNSVWQVPLPAAPGQGGGDPDLIAYEGIPDHSFETLEGASVLRMTNMLGSETRRGWSTSETFPLSNFRYEVRFNILTPDNRENVIEIWIIDALNPDRWDLISSYGPALPEPGGFSMVSSVDNDGTNLTAGYEDNTWYRLVMEAKSDQVIYGRVLSDDGEGQSGFYFYSHDFSDYESGIRIGLSQVMTPDSVASPIDVAVDYVRLETNIIPEPTTLALLGVGAVGVLGSGLRAGGKRW